MITIMGRIWPDSFILERPRTVEANPSEEMRDEYRD